ncbi:fumarylacetoacetate hydrolase family protein [Mycolicibacterium bacteremicum]|uniref:Fumarylacetoacetate hydrolase n=1 Tax=Mycolicibacterium bacteremicum TaxID=564198 RepID=A0A1W9YZJ4_MYCBA|nr:fumarylacetoacetate hydrolase family protein [Mycolicibacterium bacteremicum]MCV7435107.1 fumarylacetoacetate hydrolase family protein [Mycolicibacterium bacteremicum]ORA05342.1 fumarylacetoacetate hydrolase [Mycolicibacterium bacteremicum]
MFAIDSTTLDVAGSAERFPVRRVYCVGRNYADHAREMGTDPDREPPFYFTKPADAVFTVADGYAGGPAHEVPYPPQTENLHHEIELVVALSSGGSDIDAGSALDHVWGYGVGVDLTRRDLQDAAKQNRRPWDLSKGFDASGPVSALVPAASVDPLSGRIWITVDDELRQVGDLGDQIWPVADVIAHLSRSVTLAPGDLIMTGTPAGVGPITRGQQVRGGIDGIGELSFVVR